MTLSLALVVVGVVLALAMVSASKGDLPQVGEPCEKTKNSFLGGSSGVRILVLPGRVFTVDDDGESHPLGLAFLFHTGTGKPVRIKPPVKKDGTFTLKPHLTWETHLVCSDGVVQENKWIGDTQIRVTAKDCTERTITIDQHTKRLDIKMECER